MEKETNKPTKIFIWLSMIFSLLFIVGLILYFFIGYYFGSYLIILISLFAFYSMIMSVFIFSKKLKNVYSFAILSIIINVLAIISFYVGGASLKNGFQILSIISYFALFFVSLYNLWKK